MTSAGSAPSSVDSRETNDRPERVDDLVGDQRGDQLAPQPVLAEQVAEALDHGAAGSSRAGRAPATGPRPGRTAAARRSATAWRARRSTASSGRCRPWPARRRWPSACWPRQAVGDAVEDPLLLERRHQVLVGVQPRAGDLDLAREDARLAVGVLEDVLGDVLGDRLQQLVARSAGRARRAGTASPSRIFRLTSWSEQSTPAELSMKSALMLPPREDSSIRRELGEAEVASLPHDAAAQVGGVDADAVRGAVARVGVGLRRRLHDGADAAVEQQVDRRAQDRADDLVRRQRRRPRRRAPPGPAATAGSTSRCAARRRRPRRSAPVS